MTFLGLRLPRTRNRPWLRWTFIILGLLAFSLAVWFGGPMTGWGPLVSVLWRCVIIGAVLGVFALVQIIRWRRRVRAAREIEDALIPAEPEGDGKVLAEKMSQAMTVLKKTGGASYLYDLPWYVIIGPPGAGKTTALANSGVEFPLAQDQAISGFGGTRYVDFWFSEEAVMIDTAGRYTTQDSDAVADKASWAALLEQLKKTRPNRPINGVILSFSVEDMMKGDDLSLKHHAETVRARLAEIHEVLKIDFPVYVMFTKADLIAGFREYFASFSLNRRKLVWGVTFQNKDRKAITVESVPAEFDRLVRRLSDEIIDRMSEEPDGISRIAIFGLPGQMALLRGNVSNFLRRVFEPTRYKTNAILRGFYFTSGTQEGTPIDQVLGAMNRADEGMSFQPSFMSGKGKSFFIHDLLRRVIFPEQDWVSFDRKAVRRATVLRVSALTAILAATLGAAGAFGYSFWKNRTLVDTAQKDTAAYARAGIEELNREVIDDPDLRPVLPLLNRLETMPAGYGDSQQDGFFEGLGLGQRDRVNRAATMAYSDALERMMRPRMVLDVERKMPDIIRNGEMTDIYRALKVYLLLGGEGESTDDAAIRSWFEQEWRSEYTDREGVDTRAQLARHLDAMLTLDSDRRELLVTLDQTTVEAARAAIAQLPLDEQAYALIQDGIATTGVPEWQMAQAVPNAAQVFATRDGSDVNGLTVPAIYTYEGFWAYFYDQLAVVEEQLRKDQWVLGDLANSNEIEGRLQRLERDLMERYRNDFIASWNKVLNNLAMASMVADKPRYAALATASAAQNSPLLELVKAVDQQTWLVRELEGLDGLTPEALAGGGTGGGSAQGAASDVGNALISRVQSRSGGIQRMLIDAAQNQRGKGQSRVTAGGSTDSESYSVTRPIEQISDAFLRWHELVMGDVGQRPIDTVIGNFGAVYDNLKLAEHSPDQSAAAMPTLLNSLTRYNSQLPEQMAQLVDDAEGDFRSGASDASIETMNRALTNQITFFCRENITSAYPFGSKQRSLSIDNFARFFGPGGEMDRYFTEYLEPYVERTDQGLTYLADKEITKRFNPQTLKQFERAERIRRAYFAGGGSQPQVEITVAQVDAHPTIQSAFLSINDEPIESITGSLPRTITWPGAGKSTILQISPTLNRPSTMRIEGSSWTFIEFLGAAAAREQRGDTLRATFNLGGRNITYDFTINALANPFTMPEIRDFECPQSID